MQRYFLYNSISVLFKENLQIYTDFMIIIFLLSDTVKWLLPERMFPWTFPPIAVTQINILPQQWRPLPKWPSLLATRHQSARGISLSSNHSVGCDQSHTQPGNTRVSTDVHFHSFLALCVCATAKRTLVVWRRRIQLRFPTQNDVFYTIHSRRKYRCNVEELNTNPFIRLISPALSFVPVNTNIM